MKYGIEIITETREINIFSFSSKMFCHKFYKFFFTIMRNYWKIHLCHLQYNFFFFFLVKKITIWLIFFMWRFSFHGLGLLWVILKLMIWNKNFSEEKNYINTYFSYKVNALKKDHLGRYHNLSAVAAFLTHFKWDQCWIDFFFSMLTTTRNEQQSDNSSVRTDRKHSAL